MYKIIFIFILIFIIFLILKNSKENFQNKFPIKELISNIQNKVNNILSNVFSKKKSKLIKEKIYNEEEDINYEEEIYNDDENIYNEEEDFFNDDEDIYNKEEDIYNEDEDFFNDDEEIYNDDEEIYNEEDVNIDNGKVISKKNYNKRDFNDIDDELFDDKQLFDDNEYNDEEIIYNDDDNDFFPEEEIFDDDIINYNNSKKINRSIDKKKKIIKYTTYNYNKNLWKDKKKKCKSCFKKREWDCKDCKNCVWDIDKCLPKVYIDKMNHIKEERNYYQKKFKNNRTKCYLGNRKYTNKIPGYERYGCNLYKYYKKCQDCKSKGYKGAIFIPSGFKFDKEVNGIQKSEGHIKCTNGLPNKFKCEVPPDMGGFGCRNKKITGKYIAPLNPKKNNNRVCKYY